MTRAQLPLSLWAEPGRLQPVLAAEPPQINAGILRAELSQNQKSSFQLRSSTLLPEGTRSNCCGGRKSGAFHASSFTAMVYIIVGSKMLAGPFFVIAALVLDRKWMQCLFRLAAALGALAGLPVALG